MLQCMIPPAVDRGRQFVNANPVKTQTWMGGEREQLAV